METDTSFLGWFFLFVAILHTISFLGLAWFEYLTYGKAAYNNAKSKRSGYSSYWSIIGNEKFDLVKEKYPVVMFFLYCFLLSNILTVVAIIVLIIHFLIHL